MSPFEYTHLLQTMFYHFLISPRTFRENHIQEYENIDRMVALLQLMPPNRIVFAAFLDEARKVIFWNSKFCFKTIQGDFFKGQKVNRYYYTIKHVYYIKIISS